MTAREWLAKRAELEAAATDGPWEAEATGGNIVTPTQGTIIEVFSWADADAEWIAETRTTAPAMRKALEAVLDGVAREPDSNYYLSEWERGYRAAMLDVERLITAALEATP